MKEEECHPVDDWPERLKLCVQEAGWTHERLAKELGMTRGAVGHYFTGRRHPNMRQLVAISRAFGVSLDWLMTGEGPRSLDDKGNYQGLSATAVLKGGDFTLVPRHDITASLGHGIEVISEQIVDYLAFKTKWLLDRFLDLKKLALISAAGDSMQPTISDGDLLLVDLREDMGKARSGHIYIIRQGNHLYAKRLQWLVNNSLSIISDNKDYHTETIPADELDQVHVIGRVVWSGKNL